MGLRVCSAGEAWLCSPPLGAGQVLVIPEPGGISDCSPTPPKAEALVEAALHVSLLFCLG